MQNRLVFFVLIILLILLLEYLIPRKKNKISTLSRFPSHIALILLGNILVYLALPLGHFVFSTMVLEMEWGLLSIVNLPIKLEILLGVLLLDCVIYWQHRLSHSIPFFWKLHQLHHSDKQIDLNTAIRFHPLEILLSALIKLFFIALLGIAPVSVLIFEVILSSMALFTHGNFTLPHGIEKIMRLLLVTPDMHYSHHSVKNDEMNKNFGFNLSIWDKIFRTYDNKSKEELRELKIGLTQTDEVRSLKKMIMMPFGRENV